MECKTFPTFEIILHLFKCCYWGCAIFFCISIFIYETTEQNGRQMVLYQICESGADLIIKMVARTDYVFGPN